MPAYTTVAFQFAKHSAKDLVRSVYEAFDASGLAFDQVHAWGCDASLTLEEITEWNERKLGDDFEQLGFGVDVSNDYRQILLAGHPFSECRLYILNSSDSLAFHCIVPESEITARNCESIREAADRVWSTLPVQSIDSFGEWADDDLTQPASRLFAYADAVTDDMLPERFDVDTLECGRRLTRKAEQDVDSNA